MSPNKKVTKEVGIGEALCVALPRAKAIPLRIPRPHLATAQHLTLHPDQRENVPIFSLMVSSCNSRQGRESGAPAVALLANLLS